MNTIHRLRARLAAAPLLRGADRADPRGSRRRRLQGRDRDRSFGLGRLPGRGHQRRARPRHDRGHRE
jgi:hypothetical protein